MIFYYSSSRSRSCGIASYARKKKPGLCLRHFSYPTPLDTLRLARIVVMTLRTRLEGAATRYIPTFSHTQLDYPAKGQCLATALSLILCWFNSIALASTEC